MPEYKQTNFIGGAANDPRSSQANAFWYSENLIVGKRKSLKQMVNNQAENACAYNFNSLILKQLEIGGYLYGLGQNNNTDHNAMIWKKTSALTGNWAAAFNFTTTEEFIATYATGISEEYRTNPLFIYNSPYIIYVNGAYIGRYHIGTNTMTDQWIAAHNNGLYGVFGGVAWNGNIYCWESTKNVCLIDVGEETITDLGLAISASQVIVDMIPYQDYLAIICTSTSTTEKSKVYLYDGSTITSYDIGAGRVFGGVYQEGSLIVGMTTLNKRYITFYAFNGVNFKPLYTYSARDNAASTPYSYIAGASLMKMFGNYNYFIVTGTRPDNSYSGIYEYALARFGRDDPNDPLSFSIIKNFNFVSARGLDGQITKNNFIVLESITGAAAIPDSYISAFIYSDTNKNTYFLSSASTYSAEAGAVETFKQDGKEKGFDASIEKQLNSVSVFFAPLPSGGSVVLKYKKNEDTSWTTIFTHTTANSVEHSVVNIEATGRNLPVFNEIQYRIELLGGAELLGWKHKYTPMTQGNY